MAKMKISDAADWLLAHDKYLMPVSYTHLDVYKRQAGYGKIFLGRRQLRPFNLLYKV